MNNGKFTVFRRNSALAASCFCIWGISAGVLLSACSVFKSSSDKTPAVFTVGTIAGEYLKNVVRGDEARIGNYVLWLDLLKSGSEPISKDEFRKQLKSLQKRWTLEQHPIYGLEVVDIDLDGDNAEVVFRKAKRDDYPEIEVKLVWAGQGWLVAEDTLFGRGNLVEQWQSDPQIFKTP